MKTTHNVFYIEIKAPKLLYWYSKLNGTKGNAKAAAFYPFLITSDKIHPNMRPYFINHELIHFAQQKEMLIIVMWILKIFEWLYIFLIKNKRGMDIYLYRSTEQEAYDNMFDLEYLSKRKHYAHLRKYWKDKPIVWEDFLEQFSAIENN